MIDNLTTDSRKRRSQKVKIIATLGPASQNKKAIEDLFNAGVDVFRLNFSHGSHELHKQNYHHIREIENQVMRPIGVLADIQGPKLRVGRIAQSGIQLKPDSCFILDKEETAGDENRVCLPHPELYSALKVGSRLLIDDGKIELLVHQCDENRIVTNVIVGGEISSNKGVNVPDHYLPISPLTQKDKVDLEFALSLGVDWVAMSFVQRSSDMELLKELVNGQALLMAKIEKPSAVDHLEEILVHSDAVMVARGDLGVELPQERVPIIQKRIVKAARQAGKPVVVATQMLESMINAPVPTRAESSDVATAAYDGADAVMLSAETAMGGYPVESASAMRKILVEVENDPLYRLAMQATAPKASASTADAISASLGHAAKLFPLAAIVSYTESGFTGFRTARERSIAPIFACTPHQTTARRLTLVWGIQAVVANALESIEDMEKTAIRITLDAGLGDIGNVIAITAGMPFGMSGTTNMLRLSEVQSEKQAQ